MGFYACVRVYAHAYLRAHVRYAANFYTFYTIR